jgi:polar amino acid transport system substrate-binding protein
VAGLCDALAGEGDTGGAAACREALSFYDDEVAADAADDARRDLFHSFVRTLLYSEGGLTGFVDALLLRKRLDERAAVMESLVSIKRAGYRLDLRYTSWPLAEQGLKTGNVVAAFPYSVSDERRKMYDFSAPLSFKTNYFFYYKPKLPNAPASFKSLDELKSFRIGVQRGYWYESLFASHQLNLLYTADEESALRQMQDGHLDLAPLEKERSQYLIHQLAPGREAEFGVIATPLGKSTPLAVMFSRDFPGSAQLQEAFEKARQELVNEGSLR